MAALLLGACASTPAEVIPAEAVNETRKLVSGDYASPAWVNETFDGAHVRSLSGNDLTFAIEQSIDGGGWDTAVGIVNEPDVTVAQIDPQLAICFDYDLRFAPEHSGKWWVGPKISVNWAAMTDQPSSGDWYENYVVEMANQTPEELEADLFDFFEAESLGETMIDGATYRHIKLRFNDWWQYWSIRQDYRSAGSMTVASILNGWTGLPSELPFDGVKANIETHGPIAGSGTIHADIANQLTELNCK